MRHYQKPPLSPPEQIQKLKHRGLVINDDALATSCLSTIGFYRLSAYFIPFEDKQNTQVQHAFVPGTTFDQILFLYTFDRRLRLLVLEALERIEISIRSLWADALCAKYNNAHAYMNSNYFKDPWTHQKALTKAARNIQDSNEQFIQHYLGTYKQPFMPPTWVMTQTLSFGGLSHWYAATKDNQVKLHAAKAVGLPTSDIAVDVLHSLTMVRNTCAHHARLWNRQFTMQLPHIKKLKNHLHIHKINVINTKDVEEIQQQPDRRLYNHLVVISHMMKAIQPTTGWQTRLVSEILTLTPRQQMAMGFPDHWQTMPFWEDALQQAQSG